jgi:CRP-like cAMP-binding protein
LDITPALEQFIRDIPLFEWVERSDMMELLSLLRQVRLQAGEVLFTQGDTGTGMWVLGKGCEVQLFADDDGVRTPLASLLPGETLGEMSLIDEAPRSATAVVKQAGLAYRIDAVDFAVLREAAHPAVYRVLRKMSGDMCSRLRRVALQLVPDAAPPTGPETVLPAGRALHQSTLEAFEPLRQSPAIARLALAQKLTEHDFAAGQVLYREGEASHEVFFLVEGEVEMRQAGQAYLTLGAGSLFGLVSVIDGGTRYTTCVAKGPGKVWRLASADFDWLFAAGNRFAFKLVELVAHELSRRLRHANGSLLQHTPHTAPAPAPASDLALDLAFDKMMG